MTTEEKLNGALQQKQQLMEQFSNLQQEIAQNNNTLSEVVAGLNKLNGRIEVLQELVTEEQTKEL